MKKVCWSFFLIQIHSSNKYKLTWVAAKRSTEYVAWSSSYLLMRVQQIVEPTMGGHGLLEVSEHCGRHCLRTQVRLILGWSGSIKQQGYLRYSILTALSVNSILCVRIFEGSFTAAMFAQFIDQLLDQIKHYPDWSSVVMMDNCCIHKFSDILQMISERYIVLTHPFLALH